MTPRVEEEIRMLRTVYPDLEIRGDPPWIRIPGFVVPSGLRWNRDRMDVVFVVQPAYPAAPPKGIYVPTGLRFNGEMPNNYQDQPQPGVPFQGQWGVFSWGNPPVWFPTDNPRTGPNLLNFVRSFADRLREGR